jgi:hypothetical protein
LDNVDSVRLKNDLSDAAEPTQQATIRRGLWRKQGTVGTAHCSFVPQNPLAMPGWKKVKLQTVCSFNFLENDVIRRVHGRGRKVALLIEAYGPRMGMMRTINRHKFVEFEPKRKSAHCGKRKLRRDR